MRNLKTYIFLLSLLALAFFQGGQGTTIRYGASLPVGALVNQIFIINDGSGAIYVCIHDPTCTVVGQWISISTGQPPSASVAVGPTAVGFGSGQTGTPTAAQPVTITNNGDIAITVNSVSFGGAQFSEVNPGACNGVLKTGVVCVDLIQFIASGVGAVNDTLTVATNAPIDTQNPLTISLSGTGTGSPTFPITISCSGLGNGTVTDGGNLDCGCQAGIPSGPVCQQSYTAGPLTLTAAADPSNMFNSFTGAGLSTSPGTFTVSQAQTVSAEFDITPPDVVLTLTSTGQGGGSLISDASADNSLGVLNCVAVSGVVSSGGSAGCNGPFQQGTVITLTETPNSTSTFVGWSGVPGCTTATTCVVTINSDTTVTVNFSSSSSTVQLSLTQTVTNCAVAGTTISCNWLSPVLSGDTFICAGSWPDNTTTVSSLTDTGASTYTQVPTISPKTTTGLTQVLYYAQNVSAAGAGVRTTTMTLSSSAASSVVGTALTGGHTGGSGSTTYTSASVTFPNNHLILATTWAQLGSGNGPGPLSTLTGGGITWTLVQAEDFNNAIGTGTTTRIEVWRALGTGGSGALTATWATAPAARGMAISEFSGIDLSGSGGSGAIGITAANKGAGTNSSVTMGTFGSAGNGTFGVTGTGTSVSRTAGAGMTQLNNEGEMGDEWAAGNISPVQQTLGSSISWGTVGIEVKAAGATGRRDMRCAEYAGVKQTGSPIDQSAAAVGSSTTPASGSITTTIANDLLTGFTASASSVITPSTSFTQQMKNSFGDDEEDRQGVANSTASNFQPTLTASANWIASQVAWLAQSTATPTVFSLSLNLSGNGSGTVTSNAGTPAINCPATSCSSQVSANTSVTLTAFPTSGSVLAGWSGATGCSTSSVCIVPNITSNQNVTATFSLSGQSQYYVNHSTGANTNSGLCAVTGTPTGCTGPWQTIGKASQTVTIGAGGTVVNVAAGTYNETVNITKGGSSTTARLVFKCSAQWTVGGSTGCEGVSFNVFGANNVDIGATGKLGFTYTSSSATTAVNVIWQCGTATTCTSGNSVHVLGNYFHDIAQTATGGCPFGAAIEMPNAHGKSISDVIVDGNTIDHYGIYPNTTCNVAQGIYVLSDGGIIRNNVVTRVADGGIQYYDRACNAVIANNDLLNNRVGLIFYGGNGCTPGLSTIINNVIDNNSSVGFFTGATPPAICTSSRPILFSNNIVNGNGQNFNNSGASCETRQNINTSEAATTTFVSYTGNASGNYQLKPGSVAINGGTTQCVSGGITPCAPTKDFLSVSRPQRQSIDIGAYELP